MKATTPILQVKDLKTYFYTPEGVCKAVDGVSWSLEPKETLGIVGESGCGKSVSNLSILRLIDDPPGKIVNGEILFQDQDLLTYSEAQMQAIRGNAISMIFQDPMSSLDPVFTIGNQMAEVFQLHRGCSRKEARDRSVEALQLVRIPAPEKRIKEYPYQMSGGMRQRVMIAMALSCRPQILLADEPTTALDVTIQAQIMDLMLQLKQELDTAIVLITHDLGIIAEAAQRVIIMYAGVVVEMAMADEIFRQPRHPYTRGLLQSVPALSEQKQTRQRLEEIPGIVPSLHDLPGGCLFHPRCPEVMDICRQSPPQLTVLDENSAARCWMFAK